ncbi:hypothetical protein Hanom_Chr05g00432481 [Helianthus anomalus]
MSKHTYTSLKEVMKNNGAFTPNPRFRNYSIHRGRPELQDLFTNIPLGNSVVEDLTRTCEPGGLKSLLKSCFRKVKECVLCVVLFVRKTLGF